MGRLKNVTRHVSIRLVEDVATAVAEMAKAADWSEAKIMNHLARVGLAFSTGQLDRCRALVGEFGMAEFERRVHAEAAAKIRAARAGDRPDPDQMLIAEAIDQAAAADLPSDLALPPGVADRMLAEAAAAGQAYGRGPAAPPPAPLLVAAGIAQPAELSAKRQRPARRIKSAAAKGRKGKRKA